MEEMSYPQYVFSCGCITTSYIKPNRFGCRMTCPKPEHIGATLTGRIIECGKCGKILLVLPNNSRNLCDACKTNQPPKVSVPQRGERTGGTVWHDPELQVKRLERSPCLDCPNVGKSKVVEPCRSCAYPGIWDDQIRREG